MMVAERIIYTMFHYDYGDAELSFAQSYISASVADGGKVNLRADLKLCTCKRQAWRETLAAQSHTQYQKDISTDTSSSSLIILPLLSEDSHLCVRGWYYTVSYARLSDLLIH
jgi:hypothetical protein